MSPIPTPVVSVSLSGAYRIEDLDRLLGDIAPLLRVHKRSTIEIDLSRLSFVAPSTAAVLAAAVRRCSILGLSQGDGHIHFPDDADVKNYLLRINALQLTVGEIQESFTRHEPVGFRECQLFQTEEESVEVARALTDALTERCSLDETARFAIYTCLGELCQNVPNHAMSDLGGIALAQGYPAAHRFEVAIVDVGIGIRASLNAYEKYAGITDDAEAIGKALELGATSKPDGVGKTRHSGYGLTVTQHLLQLNGGRLVVRSGRGEVWVGAHPLVEERQVDFPGTLIVLEADTNAALDVGCVYNELLGDLDD